MRNLIAVRNNLIHIATHSDLWDGIGSYAEMFKDLVQRMSPHVLELVMEYGVIESTGADRQLLLK